MAVSGASCPWQWSAKRAGTSLRRARSPEPPKMTIVAAGAGDRRAERLEGDGGERHADPQLGDADPPGAVRHQALAGGITAGGVNG